MCLVASFLESRVSAFAPFSPNLMQMLASGRKHCTCPLWRDASRLPKPPPRASCRWALFPACKRGLQSLRTCPPPIFSVPVREIKCEPGCNVKSRTTVCELVHPVSMLNPATSMQPTCAFITAVRTVYKQPRAVYLSYATACMSYRLIPIRK